MTNEEILKIAIKQSSIDMNCKVDDFYKKENVIVQSAFNKAARRYLTLPFYCNLVSYGNNIVASINNEIKDIVKDYINKYSVEYCLTIPNIYILNNELEKKGHRICFISEYFLPDLNILKELTCDYEIRNLSREEYDNLYLPQWSNALCKNRKELDVLVIGAFDGDRLIGLTGVSADCETMWQIGIDVLPDYRKNGIASALTSKIALEVLKRGKVPFYSTTCSNIKSIRNAIKSGFKPSWIEVNAKTFNLVTEINSI